MNGVVVSCLRKQAFGTKAEAQAVAAWLNQRAGARVKEAYPCKVHAHFHVGNCRRKNRR